MKPSHLSVWAVIPLHEATPKFWGRSPDQLGVMSNDGLTLTAGPERGSLRRGEIINLRYGKKCTHQISHNHILSERNMSYLLRRYLRIPLINQLFEFMGREGGRAWSLGPVLSDTDREVSGQPVLVVTRSALVSPPFEAENYHVNMNKRLSNPHRAAFLCLTSVQLRPGHHRRTACSCLRLRTVPHLGFPPRVQLGLGSHCACSEQWFAQPALERGQKWAGTA